MPEAQLDFIHRFDRPESAADGRTLLLLHGTGGNEDDLVPLGRQLAPGAALLSPRGKVLERGMPRFFRRLAEGVFDEDDIRFRAGQLADFVAAAAARYSLDPARVHALGYSNGANIAAAMLLLRPETLAGGVLLRAMVPLVPDRAPDLHGKRVYLAAGRHDPIAGTEHPQKLAELLSLAGADVTLSWSDAGHELEARELTKVRDWLAA
ncbi:MAG: alpha/beta hydrolase [Acidobacteriota bacterium]